MASKTDQSDMELNTLSIANNQFEIFKSIVTGLDHHLFPSSIKNEASDIEVSNKLLNSEDITRFLRPEFIALMKAKLAIKASGFVKQSEIDQRDINKMMKNG